MPRRTSSNRDRWLGIELRHFSALAAVDRARSFRGAASQLGYVQSAVSRQVAVLEEAAGSRLVERSQGPRPVQLTEAGRLLLSHASEILASMEAAKADLDALLAGRAGCVRVGAFQGVPARFLGRTIAAFVRRFPEVRVEITEAATDAPLFDLVENGSIDLAFSVLPPTPGPFARCELLQIPWALVVETGAPLALRETAPASAELAHLPLITLQSARMTDKIECQLRSTGDEPTIVLRSDMAETLQDLVAAGVGVAIVPTVMTDPTDPRVTVLELGDALPPLGIGLVWHRHRQLTRAMVQFRDLLSDVCSAPGCGFAKRRFARA
jgi:DNA-binding transcriptional LysR family regulator